MSDRPSLSYLADLGSKLALPKIKESLQKMTSGKLSGGYLQALANSLNAKSDSWRAASKNIRQAIEALEVAENALNEIAALSTRLEELGALYNNNSLLFDCVLIKDLYKLTACLGLPRVGHKKDIIFLA